MSKYIQTRDVPWLKTPSGTIWVYTGIEAYIQPEDPALRDTAFGINLDILEVDDFLLFSAIGDE